MLGSRDRISLSRSCGYGSLFAHAQGRRFYGYQLIDRQALLAFAREVSSVALSHFQQRATSVRRISMRPSGLGARSGGFITVRPHSA
jgi:hypothetical protein